VQGAHPVKRALDGGGQHLLRPQCQQARVLFERDVVQCVVDARQQLLVLTAHEQVQIGGEVALERMKLQFAREVPPDHRVQCSFQADRSIGDAVVHGGQGCMPIGQVQQADLRMVGCQPAGIRAAANHGQHLRLHAADVTWRVLAFTHGQDRLAAIEGAGCHQAGAGPWAMRRAAHHQHQIGLVPADCSDRCPRAGVGDVTEAQSGMVSHELRIAVGEGRERDRVRQWCRQRAQ